MRIHSKISGTKGLVSVYNEALRFRDMITPHAEERARILSFWQKHGDAATLVDWLDFSTAVSCEQMSCRGVSYVLDEY